MDQFTSSSHTDAEWIPVDQNFNSPRKKIEETDALIHTTPQLEDDTADTKFGWIPADQNFNGTRKKIENKETFEGIPTSQIEDETIETKFAPGTFAKLRTASKSHSTPLTLKWLEENYEFAEGVCIPRSTLYLHYLDYCEKNDTQPVNAASFGKIIRQQFPQITTRRLGTRGQSKYHYYGIGVRETSIYYDIVFSAKGIQSSNEGKKECAKQIVAYSPRSKLGTLLPEFPDLKEVKLPPNIDENKVITFMMMYRTHCQRILDTVIRANFDEVQSFLLHFWQGMPQHMVPILDSQTIVMLVGVCDSILYKAIANVLMPTVLQALPESTGSLPWNSPLPLGSYKYSYRLAVAENSKTENRYYHYVSVMVIRGFAKQLDQWLRQALDSLPEGLQKIKFDLARRFAQVLRRQTSLNHLCQAARTVIHSSEITSQMLEDWMNVDLNSIIKQTLYTMDNYSEKDHQNIINLCSEFERLMEEQAPLESFIEWLDSMVDRCVVKPSSKKQGTLRRIARQFLLMWSCFGTRIIRDMTLHSAPSFGSFHLMHLMFDDYVLYLVENLHSQERANDFIRIIKGEEQAAEDMVLPDSSGIRDSFLAATGRSAFSPTFGSRNGTGERGSVITSARDVNGQGGSEDLNQRTSTTSSINIGNNVQQICTTSADLLAITSSSSSSILSCSQGYNQSGSNIPLSHGHIDENTLYGFNPRQTQLSCSSFYVAPSSGSIVSGASNSGDLSRFTGNAGIDWSQQYSTLGQADAQNLQKLIDQNMYSQYNELRSHGIDYGSYGYFDPQNTGRGFIPVGSDVTYANHTNTLQTDMNDSFNNNGKRRNDETSSKTFKRPSREQFSLQAQLEDGFI